MSAILFGTVLAVHALVGVFAFYTDFRETFSPTRDFANYLKEQNLDEYRIVVTPDYCATGLSALLQRPVYSLANLKEISFEQFNSEHKQVWGYGVPWRVSRLVQWWDRPFVLLSRDRLYTRLPVGHTRLLKRIDRSIVFDEGNYLYLVEPDKTAAINSTKRDINAHSMYWQVWPTRRVQRFFNYALSPRQAFGRRPAPSWYVRLRPVECSKAVP